MDEFTEDFVMLGNSFMRSGYFVYDLENHVVAIAQAAPNATKEDITSMEPSGTEIPGCTITNTFTMPARRAATATVDDVVSQTLGTFNGAIPSPTFALGDLEAGANNGNGGGSSSSGGGSNSNGGGGLLVPSLGMVVVGALAVVL